MRFAGSGARLGFRCPLLPPCVFCFAVVLGPVRGLRCSVVAPLGWPAFGVPGLFGFMSVALCYWRIYGVLVRVSFSCMPCLLVCMLLF